MNNAIFRERAEKHCLEDKFDIYASFKCWNVDAIVFDWDNKQVLKLQKRHVNFFFVLFSR